MKRAQSQRSRLGTGAIACVIDPQLYFRFLRLSSTYDHRTLKTRLPVRSALFKQRTGGLVVRWVTTSEYPLLYVFAYIKQCYCFCRYRKERKTISVLLVAILYDMIMTSKIRRLNMLLDSNALEE
jgi:hypothetical protein